MSIWAITSFFNPAGYARRRRNYHAFRRALRVPLVTVELSFDGAFELAGGDADVLVRRHGGDVMWQKERLLNVAIDHVPADCEAIAWIDCDVVFADDGWVGRAESALRGDVLVHLWTERCDLPPDVDPATPRAATRAATAESAIARVGRGTAVAEDFHDAESPVRRGTSVGLAWAARADILRRHRLYDACITGTGDRAIVCAALGEFEHAARALDMNGARLRHYLEWATPFGDAVGRRVSAVDGRVYHLWHGDLRDRAYRARHDILRRCDFDPERDIALDASGAWRWASEKPPLHAALRQYFDGRREDGVESGHGAAPLP